MNFCANPLSLDMQANIKEFNNLHGLKTNKFKTHAGCRISGW